ncbi:expressed protein [Phakopsora pachyrhizi]|uniref:Expressed protein n=1 Tax=Phakopsora pachyrhizi TaxID=170000 RepID=A0AAV0BH90_PHAPC|nr:expressed protein [Phakopsora pachyrhizi]
MTRVKSSKSKCSKINAQDDLTKRRTVWKQGLSNPLLRSWSESQAPDEIAPKVLEVLLGFLGSSKRSQSGGDISTTEPRRTEKLKDLLIGINKLTRTLEQEISSRLQNNSLSPERLLVSDQDQITINQAGGEEDQTRIASHKPYDSSDGPISLIFICGNDLNPASMSDHLLETVATVNSLRAEIDRLRYGETPTLIYLTVLPKGAEQRLAKALGIKRVAAIGIKSTLISEKLILRQIIDQSMKKLYPWNKSSDSFDSERAIGRSRSQETRYILSHIKHYKTSAPIKSKSKNKNKAGK